MPSRADEIPAMFLFSRVRNAVETPVDIDDADGSRAWNPPPAYDAALVGTLTATHDDLDARIAALLPMLGDDPAEAGRSVRGCATTLQELRQTEASCLYPLIARGISSDPIARRLFWQSRIVMLGLERRVMRRFEDLDHAIETGSGVGTAAAHLVNGLAEYRQRNESSMYPLYDAVGRHIAPAPARVA